MNRKYILLICTLAILPLARGQSISQKVIANSGTYTSSGGNSLEFTVGELVVSTLNVSGNILTQGFHQTYTGTSFINEQELMFTVNVYPNPTVDNVNIVMSSSFPIEFTAAVYDSYGKYLFSSPVSDSCKESLSFIDLAAGTYFITLYNSVNHLSIKTIQIQKISNQ